jgi:hypothetical protein
MDEQMIDHHLPYLLKIVASHSYVKLPEGKQKHVKHVPSKSDLHQTY